ncbi:metallophosphoesterase [Jatrophihabitans telluris]|uniref:Metallophosphoesterase n=1 Tax=Jatrophihabitans telluris TaxID=2038343 RepID=A0ABY4QZB9_9ACTN|nr:metallophosphoesterase [Jatrophihabitans telluris]UQX88592.1 metallophosphoesterase [Jatrophihabitans telluris]
MTSTATTSITGGDRSPQGYWTLAAEAGESHTPRRELMPGPGGRARTGTGRGTGAGTGDSVGEPLLTVAHLSDLHLCDSQSPARAEFLDRWADPDSPLKPLIDAVGTYRAQDCLTVQVAEAMVRAVNGLDRAPVSGAPIDLALTTGDVTDNAQANELSWYLSVLEGGPILPDSGDPTRYEGVGAADLPYWDEYFWHPDPIAAAAGNAALDRPRRLHGFPAAPGLLDALRMPFDAEGLTIPWLAVHGNHDQMVQGTIPAVGPFATAAFSQTKAIGVPEHWSTDAIGQFCLDMDRCELPALALWSSLRSRPATPDPGRAPITRAEFIAAHFGLSAHPSGHGFPSSARESGLAYYRHDRGRVSILALDTVNENGGWEGSIDPAQLSWLAGELDEADADRRLVVLASHHPLHRLTNARTAAEQAAALAGAGLEDGTDGSPGSPGSDGSPGTPGTDGPRVLSAELSAELARHACVVLWLNGHTHVSAVTPHPAAGAGGPWWEVTAPSLIDYPQQGRVVELLDDGAGELTLACTMIDHAGEVPWSGGVDTLTALAGLSRELAANDWQDPAADLRRHRRVGTPLDRNVLLAIPDPFQP